MIFYLFFIFSDFASVHGNPDIRQMTLLLEVNNQLQIGRFGCDFISAFNFFLKFQFFSQDDVELPIDRFHSDQIEPLPEQFVINEHTTGVIVDGLLAELAYGSSAFIVFAIFHLLRPATVPLGLTV